MNTEKSYLKNKQTNKTNQNPKKQKTLVLYTDSGPWVKASHETPSALIELLSFPFRRNKKAGTVLSYCLGEQESTVHCDTCVDLRVRRRMSSLSHRLPASLDSKSAYREGWGGGAGGVSLWTSSGAREEQHLIRYPITFCLIHFRRVSHWAWLVVRKPSGYSICVPCPAFYMGSEELSSGSHTAHAYPHVCSPVTWHLHACAVSIPCCSPYAK